MAKSKVLKGGEKIPKEIEDDFKDQQHFEGMEPMEKNPKIHKLAKRYKAKSLESSRAKAEADGLKELLAEAMKEAGLPHYFHGDVTVHVDPSFKMTIKVESAGDEE